MAESGWITGVHFLLGAQILFFTAVSRLALEHTAIYESRLGMYGAFLYSPCKS